MYSAILPVPPISQRNEVSPPRRVGRAEPVEDDMKIDKATIGIGNLMEAVLASIGKSAQGGIPTPGGTTVTGPGGAAGAPDLVAQAKIRIENAMDLNALLQIEQQIRAQSQVLPPEIEQLIAAKKQQFQGRRPAPGIVTRPGAAPAPVAAPAAPVAAPAVASAFQGFLKKVFPTP